MKDSRSKSSRRGFVTIMCALLILSVVSFVYFPNVSAAPDEWTEETDTDFQDSFGQLGFTTNVGLKGSGAGAYVDLNVTWGWNNMTTPTNPGLRDTYGFAFDGKNKVAVLFGGRVDGIGKQNDTWEYNYTANTWTEVIADGTTASPPRRDRCQMVYDSVNEVIVLWGGVDEFSFPLPDTWEYDVNTNTWTEILPFTFPPPMTGYAMAYDSLNSRSILVGTNETPPGGTLHLWEYDAAIDTWNERTATPYPRAGHGMAFNGELMIVQGGAWGTMGEIRYDDTLVYNYTSDSWTRYNYWMDGTTVRPGDRTGNAMARHFDGVFDVNGQDQAGILKQDVFNFTVVDYFGWVDQTPPLLDPKPGPRQNHRMVRNSDTECLILYGGMKAGGLRLNDTWAYCTGYAAAGQYVSYGPSGFYFDSGTYPNWLNIWWNETSPPPGTSLQFQLQGDNDSIPGNGSPGETLFGGFDGSPATYYTVPGTAIWSGLDFHRYIRYKVNFAGTFTATPEFHNITLGYEDTGPPFIKSTDPADNELFVDQWKNITVIFSKSMNTGTFTWTISPDPSPGSWTEVWSSDTRPDDKVVLSHPQPYDENQKYMVTVTYIEDTLGNPLDPLLGEPNPWNFTTAGIKPWIVSTVPPDNDVDVPLWTNISVDFSESMDPTTLLWTINPTTPPIGDYQVKWWDNNKTLSLNHTAQSFQVGKEYTVVITQCTDEKGNILDSGMGAPNPWSFWTFNPEPYLTSSDPSQGTTGVGIWKNITVTFNKEMDASTVVLSFDPPGPDPGPGWTKEWSSDNLTFYFNHTTNPFSGDSTYWANISGDDIFGTPLNRSTGAPDPWWFETVVISPWIATTTPANGTVGVPVNQNLRIDFSEVMNPSTLIWSIVPDPGTWIQEWGGGFDKVYLNHTNPFAEQTGYDVTVACNDTTGNPLVAGPAENPFWFETGFAPPFITSTDPFDGESGVGLTSDVVVVFSEEMDTPTVTWTFSNPAIVFTPAWSLGNTTLTLSHVTPYDVLTTYTFEITAGDDMDGLALVPGTVPNPWNFTTYVQPPANLTVTTSDPDIRITWESVTNAVEYRVYHSEDRFDLWPWMVLATVPAPTTAYVHVNTYSDGLSHYYIVRAFNGNGESGNSTIGAKAERDFFQQMNPALTDINWFSLPFESKYLKASDIANDLGGTNIQVIGKWDPSKQKASTYVYHKGRWRGKDFSINPGDGLFVSGIKQDFTWTITGTDTEELLGFNYYPRFTRNINWISIPYTGQYFDAMALVVFIEGNPGTTPTKITEIGKWDPATQTSELLYWNGTAWAGPNFSIDPGDGIFITVISNFNWQIILVTPTVP
jgi:hypothetical protein